VCPPTLSRPSQSCLLSVSVHHFINHCSTLIQTPCFNQNNVVCPNPCFTLGATIDKTLFYEIKNFTYEAKGMSPDLPKKKMADLVKMYDKFIDPIF
jgi:hypothetical protein